MDCFDKLQERNLQEFINKCEPYNEIYNYFLKYYEICELVKHKDNKLIKKEILSLLQKKREKFLHKYYIISSKYSIRRNWSFQTFHYNNQEHSY